MGLGPQVCVACRVVYDYIHYTNEEGYECTKWFCPKCKKEDSTDYALTINKELFDELFPKDSK